MRKLALGTWALVALLLIAPAAFGSTFVSGEVFNDLNGSGGGGPGLQGWTVNLLDNGFNLIASNASAADGSYSFDRPGAGLYHVQLMLVPGWVQTSGSSDYVVNGDGTYSNLNFGVFQLVSVSGNVYNDLNLSGHQDAGEPGLSGWTLELSQGGNLIATATSDVNGSYMFSGVGPGNFDLSEILQPGWTQTQPNGDYTFTTSSGVNVVGAAFGNAIVPEPASFVLLGCGLAGVAGIVRRRNRA